MNWFAIHTNERVSFVKRDSKIDDPTNLQLHYAERKFFVEIQEKEAEAVTVSDCTVYIFI